MHVLAPGLSATEANGARSFALSPSDFSSEIILTSVGRTSNVSAIQCNYFFGREDRSLTCSMPALLAAGTAVGRGASVPESDRRSPLACLDVTGRVVSEHLAAYMYAVRLQCTSIHTVSRAVCACICSARFKEESFQHVGRKVFFILNLISVKLFLQFPIPTCIRKPGQTCRAIS